VPVGMVALNVDVPQFGQCPYTSIHIFHAQHRFISPLPVMNNEAATVFVRTGINTFVCAE
jgi:hypothetical protein